MSSTSNSHTQAQPQSISLTVFNDYLSDASTSSSLLVVARTNDSFDDVLGFYDQLALQVVVSDTMVGTAPAALTVQITHSADGHHFVAKNAAPEVDTPTQLNIGTPTYMSFGFDGGSSPSLGLVRLVIVLTATGGPVRAHVRITATGNNQNEQAFSRTVAAAMSAQARSSRTYVLQYGPGQKIATSAISELVRFVHDLPTVTAAQLIAQKTGTVAEVKALILWEPILRLKNAGGFSGSSVTVPNGFIIAFLSTGHYVLVNGNFALWESKHPSQELFPRRDFTPAKPTFSTHENWTPIAADHTGPGYTTGNPPGGIKFGKNKGE